MRLLVVEDDKEAARHIVKGLTEAGYVVDHAADGKEGLLLAVDRGYDALRRVFLIEMARELPDACRSPTSKSP